MAPKYLRQISILLTLLLYPSSRVHLSAVWIGAALLSTEILHSFHDFFYTLSVGFSHPFRLMAYKSLCQISTWLTLLLYPSSRVHLHCILLTLLLALYPGFTCIDITSLPCIQGSPPLVPTATAHWCAQDPYGLCSADVDLFYISLPELPLSVGQASTGLT